MSTRVVVNPYGPSNSAKELASYLGIKRLKVRGSKFNGRSTDIVINWGIGKGNCGSARQLNSLESVRLASNKLQTLSRLIEAGISTPDFTDNYNDVLVFREGVKYIARHTLHGHSGDGIEVFTYEEGNVPRAPLYVEYIEKVREYRAIVVGDRVVDLKQKKKRNSPRDANGEVIEDERVEHDEHVWNLDGGYIFSRNNIHVPDDINSISINSIAALGLDFGAVDIIEDREGKLYVLEVNTAFGLEGTTIELVGDAIKEMI